MYMTHRNCNLQPLAEMPIWARLQFAEMIPKTYFWEEDLAIPRLVSEATVQGFERYKDVVWIHFTIDWVIEGVLMTLDYIWPAKKNSRDG